MTLLANLNDAQKLELLLAPQPNNAPPIPPVNVIATAGAASGAVDVQWNHRQPRAVSSFVIVSSGGQSVEISANGLTQQSGRIAGLTNGSAQTFTVVAKNSVSPSPSSIPSNSVTPSATPSSILPVSRALEFWWSARRVASPPADGADLASLVDMSGNGYNALGRVGTDGGATGRVLPTWKAAYANGRPAAQVNGYGSRFDTLVSGLSPGMRSSRATVAIVYATTANANPMGSLQGRAWSTEGNLGNALANGDKGFGIGTGSVSGSGGGDAFSASPPGNNNPSIVGPAIVFGTPTIAIASLPGKLRVNGTEYASATGVTNYKPLDFYGMGFATHSFGAQVDNANNRALTGYIAEILIFADLLSPAEIAALETYLQGA